MNKFLLLLLIAAPALAAQTVNLVGLTQPAASPVEPGTTTHEVLQFRMYKAAGSPAATVTQIRVTLGGSASTADWDALTLYYDVDGSRTVNAGDQLLGTATISQAGKVTFGSLTQPVQDGFSAGRDYLVCVNVAAGAVVDNTFIFSVFDTDVTTSAGTVSGSAVSNEHTVRINTGTEINVTRGGNPVPSSMTAYQDIGYVPTSGGAVTFAIGNTGTATLDLTGTPIAQLSHQVNCGTNVTLMPPATIGVGGSSDLTVAITPSTAAFFSFRITIPNSDFDEHPYIIVCQGSAAPLPIIELEYASTPVLNGGSIAMGSNAAGVGVAMVFTIYNTGGADLDLIGTPEADFPVANNVGCELTVAPAATITQGSNTTFTIEFTPHGSGSFDFAVRVLSNDAPRNPFYILVTGSAPAVTPTQLSVFRQPAGAAATVAFTTQPIVAVTNAVGGVDSSHNGTVIVASLSSGPSGAALGGTTQATVVNGYATFTNLSVNLEGTGYTLAFAAQGGAFTATNSQAFSAAAAPPAPPPPPADDDDDDGGGCSTHDQRGSWLVLWGAAALVAVVARRALPRRRVC